MKRTRVVAGRTVLVTAAVAVGLAGCSALSPATIETPYPASDGVGIDLPGTAVSLRNVLVVGTAKGSPASVVGTVVNGGSTPVQVGLQADLGAGTQPTQTVITVGPFTTAQIGPDQKNVMVIPQLAVAPGSDTGITAATQAGGRTDALVPVMLAQGEYSTLTPAPTPTATPTPSATATSSKKSTSSSKKSKSTATPTGTPTVTPTK